MFDFYLSAVVQKGLPVSIMFQVFSYVLGKKNVAHVAAVHHALRDVNSGTGDIGAIVYVGDGTHRAAVNSHSNSNRTVIVEELRNFGSASNRRFWRTEKDEGHSVARCHAD